MCANLWLCSEVCMQLSRFFLCVCAVGLRALSTFRLNKEEHDEPNPDRRPVFVRMLGSLSRFALGAPPHQPPLSPQLTQLGSV